MIGDRLLKRIAGRSFGSDGFRGSVFKLAGGSVVVQVLAVAAAPILTRLYTPADFGALAVYGSVLSLLAVIATLRLEQAIPLPEDDAMGADLLVATLGAVGLVGALTALGVLFLEGIIRSSHRVPLLVPYLWLLPIGVLAVGAYQALLYWALRRGAFGRVARTKVSQGAGAVIAQIALGPITTGALGLLVGDVVGRASGTGTLATMVWKQDREVMRRVSWQGMRAAISRYRRFPMVSVASAALNVGGVTVAPVLFATLYGAGVAGWFALGQRVVAAPMAFIGAAISQAYTGEASRLLREQPDKMRGFFLRTARTLFLIGIGPLIVLAAISPPLFSFVFGHQWREAGVYAQLLSLAVFIQLIAAPLSNTLYIVERISWQFWWDLARLAAVLAAIIGAHALGWSAAQAMALYGVVMFVSYLAHLFLCNAALKHPLARK